ncbi:hypothetical protein [Gordonia aquimaris]|uniref:IrrE N-terminal-like domain-containing protein n=1 Tax=Gordonia aquimaris TaxID=2984863 RepID=A0A9X3I770_9ACTN|nr:hypothetical protein [Gordonia aquimaris]MCX2966269.1 hypothetical protein [Gordonia aquimaris]
MKVFGREISDVDDLIRYAPLTPPWSVSDIAWWIEQEAERAVRFQPWPEIITARRVSCTLLVRTPSELRIFYENDRSDRHQRMQAGHEFGHIMEGHLGLEVADGIEIGAASNALIGSMEIGTLEYVLGSRSAAASATEHIQRSNSRRGRSGRHPYYSAQQEIAAEILGTKIGVCMRGSITDDQGPKACRQGAGFVERLRQ